MKTLEEVYVALDALGRPDIVLGHGLDGLAESYRAAKRWDDENPEKAARYRELCALQAELQAEKEQREASVALTTRLLAVGTGSREAGHSANPSFEGDLGAACRIARAWWESDAAWLLLCGNTGTGKTVAAAWAMREALKAVQNTALRTAAQLARLSSFDEGAVERGRLERVHLLVVDDIGAEPTTAWGQGMLSDLLDTRHRDKRRTILTSNLSFDAFKARVGERIADRIREDGQVHALTGKSLRRKGKAA